MASTARAQQMLDKAIHFLTLAEQALVEADSDTTRVVEVREQAEVVLEGLANESS